MEFLYHQIDDLRENRQAWTEWLENKREQDNYRREEWFGYREYPSKRGVIEMDMVD